MIQTVEEIGGYQYIKTTFRYADDKAIINKIIERAAEPQVICNNLDQKLESSFSEVYCKADLLGHLMPNNSRSCLALL